VKVGVALVARDGKAGHRDVVRTDVGEQLHVIVVQVAAVGPARVKVVQAAVS
jgi:hypothetical protein